MILTLFWIAVIFAACTLLCLAEELWDQRQRRRRIERLRERRRYLDGLEPKRWTT